MIKNIILKHMALYIKKHCIKQQEKGECRFCIFSSETIGDCMFKDDYHRSDPRYWYFHEWGKK